MSFVHLHVHTQYSILDGLSNIEKLFKRAEQLDMPGLAITDHGNMYGVKEFLDTAKNHPDVKPIVGCEVYVSIFDHTIKDKEHKGYYHLILLAKNYNGYKNLMKIVSTGFIEGFYNRPRVSHEVIEKYHDDLICCSACMAGEVPRKILAGDIAGAEEAINWHKRVFGEDYYLEVMLHKTEIPGLSLDLYNKQKEYDEEIFRLAAKHNVKTVATNDVHFVRKEDGPAHDRLICLTTNSFLDEENRLRYTQQEYLKSEDEMMQLFPGHLEALANTVEVLNKISVYEINRDHVLPKFQLPDSFVTDIPAQLEKYNAIINEGRNDEKGNYRGDEFCASVAFLCHLTYKGAEERYPELNADVTNRIDFELKTISRMGFPDYFLIVQDFISHARSQGISVGPGRGSAAGSVVSYCLGITNLDPVKYGLLFERFLNPERVSMPDIDVDFDDDGRYKVIQYVQDRYGIDHISHVITFGTMAAKLAVKDVARISRLSIPESTRLTKMIPDRTFIVKENGAEKEIKPTLANCVKYVPELKNEMENGDPLVKEVLKYALQLEGCVRQTGIHACAMIIGRGNLTDYIPISVGTDKATGQEVWVSQYEGTLIENVGMLKMDFLGLRTLSIIKECLRLVKKNYDKDIDIEQIPIDDPKVYELYSRGDTKSIFQFESPGMREWLITLHPERFEDLIAMNALYRPGPMDYIPQFVARKNGKEPIRYDLPEMEEFLKETYGVTVYQEQVMQISQKVAGFSKGKADKLRKAMGKKNKDILDGLYKSFIEGGLANNHPQMILDKIWKDWESFAKYAFNKSHATCYAWVSYQTAWLKAYYPAEFQAANLSQNLSNMEEMKEIMADCKKNKIAVLSPDINESDARFSVNREGNIRFGLGGLKGFGDNIVEAIIRERKLNGSFSGVFDFIERMSGTVNRKALDILICAGAFDSFGIKRAQFYVESKLTGEAFADTLLRYGELFRNDKQEAGSSLFGEAEEIKPVRPEIPAAPVKENLFELLQKEKELVGMYLSAHPLDRYAFEIRTFTTEGVNLANLEDCIDECGRSHKNGKFRIAGQISDIRNVTTKTGLPGAIVSLEDFDGIFTFRLYSKDYEKFMPYIKLHEQLFIEGEVVSRRDDLSRYDFKIRNMMLLGNVAPTFLEGIRLYINTKDINAQSRKALTKLFKSHKGSSSLYLFLSDEETHYNLDFYSKKYQVNVCDALVSDLETMGIAYKILKK